MKRPSPISWSGLVFASLTRTSFADDSTPASTSAEPEGSTQPAPRFIHFGAAVGGTYRYVLTLPTFGAEITARISGERGHFEGAVDLTYAYARTKSGLSFHAVHPLMTASYIAGPARFGGGLGFGILALERASAPRAVYELTVELHALVSVDIVHIDDAATLLLGLRGQLEPNLFSESHPGHPGGGTHWTPGATLFLGARF